jgi:hypothetical protein
VDAGARLLDETFYEGQGFIGDFAPATVDRQGVTPIWNRYDFSDAGVALLLLE